MMTGLYLRSIVVAACLLGATASAAPASPFMPTTGATSQPIGHFEFCQTHAAECDIHSSAAVKVRLTPEAWNELVAVNAEVNRRYVQATDAEIFGREEHWTYPSQAGDCEDLALQKRLLLIERGWPVNSLLVTVVRQPSGAGHAVLTVLTDRGDLVLDNLDPRVLLWSDTQLSFVKRQSEFHTGRWTAIRDGRRIGAVGSPAR